MAEIVTDDLTTSDLPGTGVFDELMVANQVRLDREWEKNRIRGADYAKVYLGTMEATLAQSVVYLLGRQKADKEAELIEEQTKKVTAEIELIHAQVIKTHAETSLIEQEEKKVFQETLNLEATYDQILAQKNRPKRLLRKF